MKFNKTKFYSNVLKKIKRDRELVQPAWHMIGPWKAITQAIKDGHDQSKGEVLSTCKVSMNY